MGIPFQSRELIGYGLTIKEEAHIYRPEEIDDLSALIHSGQEASYIARGFGRSFGDAAFNDQGGIILQARFNHLVSFDDDSGVLEVEAEITLAELIDLFVPRGYFLPVTPGTKYITIGGAIANDVHGRNHLIAGAFSENVQSFTLLIASGEMLTCSRKENSDLFFATVGGLGLTGVIMSAKIKLVPIETAYIEVDYQKTKTLTETLDMLGGTTDSYMYSSAWIDCLSAGDKLGRAIIMRGYHAEKEAVSNKVSHPLVSRKRKNVIVPFHLPTFTLNEWSTKAFNELYYRIHKDQTSRLLSIDHFFYPLDGVTHWNRIYGKQGVVRYQAVFPHDTAEEGLTKMLEKLQQTKGTYLLAELKRFGQQNQGLLSFPHEGYSLSMDIQIKDQSTFAFIKELDHLVSSFNGRIYLSQDTSLPQESLLEMYPRLKEFHSIKNEVDPGGLFSSTLARRLGIGGVTS